MPSLEVVIGLLLIILFYSLLGTVIMELISSFLALRGKHLERVLKMLLSSDDKREEILDAFKSNTVYQQLSGKFYGKKTPPSYMEAPTFRSILMRIISRREDGSGLREKIDSLPDEHLKQTLLQFWDESGDRLEVFQNKLEGWFDNVMDRASGWYKRNVTKILLVLGMIIAITFNVDLLAVFNNLNNASKADLDQLVNIAQVVSQEEVFGPGADAAVVGAVNREVFQALQEDISELRNPLGIGWDEVEPTSNIFYWLLKIFGWAIMAICISKGAPFWFDLLKKAVNFRNTGSEAKKVEVPSAPSTVSVDSTSSRNIPTVESPVG